MDFKKLYHDQTWVNLTVLRGCRYENGTGCHRWLALELDPTTGTLYKVSDVYKYKFDIYPY